LTAKEGPPVDAETADLLFGLARAQAATLPWHQLYQAYISLNRAFDCYVELGAIPRALAVAQYTMHIAPRKPHGIGGSTGTTHLVARALTLIPVESRQAGYLLACYGQALGVEEGDYARATEALERAVTIARYEKDLTLELSALNCGALVDLHHLHWSETLDKGLQAAQLARQIDEPLAEVWAHYWAAHTSHVLGDLTGAIQQATVGLAVAERLRDPNLLSSMLWTNEFVSELQGDWEAARHYSDRGLAVATADQRLLCTRAVLEYQVGEFSQGEVYLVRFLESVLMPSPGSTLQISVWHNAFKAIVIPMLAQISGLANRFDAAEAAAQVILSAPSATPLVAKWARTGLALIAHFRRDIAAARKQYDALEANQSTISSFLIADDRLLGLLSTTQGQFDRAVAYFKDALAFCSQAGYRPELAWTCYDYANALLQRDKAGDQIKAMPLLDQSLAISSELGMRPLIERVVSLREQAQTQPGKAPEFLDGLTQREVEVLRLIALGKSNRQIGEELFISLNTVERHVSNILTKIDAGNRADATRYAIRNELVS
jgi:DNA-binding CsgD family transcriptional regulator